MLLKSVNIWPNNHKNNKGKLTFETQCISMVGVLGVGVARKNHSDIGTVFDHVTPDVLQTF